MPSSAARTNLSSNDVLIGSSKIGEGAFRICVSGTFIGGNRNQQAAACKRFKPEYRAMENEFFAKDFQIIDRAIQMAEEWNEFCDLGKEVLITKGEIHASRSGIQYLVEPLIRFYEKFTSNGGWIGDSNGDWQVRCMEAFSHFSYHTTGGSMIVCDLQGRYRYDSRNERKCRFELTDPAICSRRRDYGPTDLGEKGIESFFANHECNEFCQGHWARPRTQRQWFPLSRGTSMLSSRMDHKLRATNPATFRIGINNILEEEEEEEDDYDDYY